MLFVSCLSIWPHIHARSSASLDVDVEHEPFGRKAVRWQLGHGIPVVSRLQGLPFFRKTSPELVGFTAICSNISNVPLLLVEKHKLL